ncbi:MAG: sirohydrochlorin chelatase [Opitutales bacterium]
MKLLLVDNGSLEPAATLGLRAVAGRLGARIGREVAPVSLLYSDQVPAAQTGGVVAEILEPWLRRELAAGETEFAVLPFFVGPSRAITDYLPALVGKLREECPLLRVRVAPALYQPGDPRLARVLAERVRTAVTPEFARGEPLRVALADHGSPVPAVTAVRDALAAELAAALGREAAAVAPCSMERRPGPAYAFNEPLLATLLRRMPYDAGPVVVAQLFLLPGRHAGPDGDIAAICRQAETVAPSLRTVRTEVLCTHPDLIAVLADRWAALPGWD